ncbi:MAG: 4'-phosphopantetheinyl transferase superfamily protein [Halanaerobiales bacterium]|nr:4'-phosphopantetheinyl transferase superfamily protein [Halanaerobiales bacterium]
MNLQKIQDQIFSLKKTDIADHYTWLIDVQEYYKYINYIKRCLSDEESRRSEEIKFEKTKCLFCLRKGITRIIISSFLNMIPHELKYNYNANGKPFISNNGYLNFDFNISHSKEYLLVGIVKSGDIGVDIEKINPKLKFSLLAKSIFSPREMALYRKYDKFNQLRSVYKAWVQKEAISKAMGIGISIGFNKISVNIDPNVNDEQYSLYLDNLKYSIKMSVKFERDYFVATALV